MVKMPELPVIPEVISESYDTYARQVTKRRHGRGTTPNKSRKANVVVKKEPQPDYFGLDNSMKNLTLSKPRKWRTKDSGNGHRPSKRSSDAKGKPASDDEDKSSVASCDRRPLRKGRSFLYTKFKYPEKYHHPSRMENVHLEENIPQCLRKSPRYSNLPIRQACCYKPVRSVTQLRVHSVLSNRLPHPAPEQTLSRRRRPTSAPPRSLASSFNGTLSSLSGRQRSFEGLSSGSTRRHSSNDKTTIQHVTFDNKPEQDVERNGTFQYSYEDDEPTHVTLEVEESDEEKTGEVQAKSLGSSQDPLEAVDSARSNPGESTTYSDNYESDSAKSVDSELDRL